MDIFNHIDFNLAVQVANATGVTPPTQFAGSTDIGSSPALSMNNTAKNTILSRRIAFLVGPGYDAAQLRIVRGALRAQGAHSYIIAQTKGSLDTGDFANFTYYSTRSVQYDALVLVGGTQYNFLNNVGEAVFFVKETFKHYKAIIAMNEGVDFLATMNFPGIDLAVSSEVVSSEGVVTVRSLQPSSLQIDSNGSGLGADIFDAIAAHRHYLRPVSEVPV